MSKGKEVAKVDPKTKAVAAYDYGADAGDGYQDQDASEVQIPYLALLQGLSKQVTEGDQKPGTLFNTVTEEVYGQDINIVPAYRELCYVEWTPLDQGGGFVARHEKGSEFVREAKEASGKSFGVIKLKNGNELIETIYLYGIIARKTGELEPIVIAFTSTKLAIYRKWNTSLNIFSVVTPSGDRVRPPRYAHLVSVGVKKQTKPPHTFFNLTLSPANGSLKESLLTPDDPRYIEAKKVAEMVKAGMARAADVEPGGGEEGDDVSF